jgi:biotin carboxyl carrier protein
MAEKLIVRSGARESSLEFPSKADGGWVIIDGTKNDVDFRFITPNIVSLLLDGRSYIFHIFRNESGYEIDGGKGKVLFEVEDAKTLLQKQLLGAKTASAEKILIKAPMPGLVVKILTEKDALVSKGTPLVVVEAMKMENELTSPLEGKVMEIRVSERQAVEKNEPLITIVSK